MLKFFGRKGAFTLIELLVVITIIALLITIIAVSFGPAQRKSRDSKRKADINLFISGTKLFESDFKVLPNHTFYLGRNAADTGAANSNYDLGADIATCATLVNGHPNNFAANADFSSASPVSNPGTASSYDTLILRPGFAAVNHFLICLKYTDRQMVDPNFTSTDGYQYRVSYDYAEFLASVRLEHTIDPTGLTQVFTGGGNNGEVLPNKRYFEGNGRNTRQLDEDTNVGGDFYTFTSNGGAANDGKYFYQCARDAAGVVITRDLRSDSTKAPITTNSGGSWVANTAGCQNPVNNGNDVAVVSY